MRKLEAHVVRDRLDYDAETGIFRWKIRTTNVIKVGEVAGHQTAKGRIIGLAGTQHNARRLAWLHANGSIPEGYEVRVINRDESDLRLCNLELSTVRQRMERHPKHKNNRLGVQGVSEETSNGTTRYRAKLCREGRVIYTSSHRTLEAAVAARAAALQSYEETKR